MDERLPSGRTKVRVGNAHAAVKTRGPAEEVKAGQGLSGRERRTANGERNDTIQICVRHRAAGEGKSKKAKGKSEDRGRRGLRLPLPLLPFAFLLLPYLSIRTTP